jgi:hypothetical protein
MFSNLPKTFFAAKRQLSGIHQIAKVFPAGGDFVDTFLQFDGNPNQKYLIKINSLDQKM